MYGNPQNRPANYFYTSQIPATITILAANVLTFFLIAAFRGGGFASYLIFNSQTWPTYFWTLFTWPLIGAGDPLGMIFSIGWGYLFLSSLERAWTTRIFLAFFLTVSALSAFTFWLGAKALGGNAAMAGLWIACAAPAVAWAVLNRREVVGLFFLPIPAPWMAAVAMAVAWFHAGPPLLGLFALSGCAVAYWYATQGRLALEGYASARRPASGAGPTLRFRDFDREPVRSGFDPLRSFRAWKQRRALEKLMRRSGFSDSDHHRNRPN